MKFKKRYFFKVTLLLITLPVLWIVYSLFKNNAPITQGDFEYGVSYKKDKELDIYYPTKKVYDKAPVVFFIHGGAWLAGRKEAVNFNRFIGAFNNLREAGYAIVSPEYTLARDGKSPFPSCIIDAYDALEWVKNHGDSLSLDINNIGIMGESAGAHISMMMAFGNPEIVGLNYESTDFKYIIDVYGPNDMNALYHGPLMDTINTYISDLPTDIQDCINIPNKLFGFDPTQDSTKTKQFADKFSPILYISSNIPRILIIHGTADQIVNVNQSKNLKRQLDSLSIKHEFHLLDGVNHAFGDATEEQKSNVQDWIFGFITKKEKSVSAVH